jgi:hypothetical protein
LIVTPSDYAADVSFVTNSAVVARIDTRVAGGAWQEAVADTAATSNHQLRVTGLDPCQYYQLRIRFPGYEYDSHDASLTTTSSVITRVHTTGYSAEVQLDLPPNGVAGNVGVQLRAIPNGAPMVSWGDGQTRGRDIRVFDGLTPNTDYELQLLTCSPRTTRLTTGPLGGETIVRSTGVVRVGDVEGWSEWYFNDAGFWHYRGHMHNAGFWGQEYELKVALDFGGPIPFADVQRGDVGGTLDFESRDDDWSRSGYDPRISANWPGIRGSVLGGTLRIWTDPGSVAETLLGGLGAAVVAAAGIFLYSGAECQEPQPFADQSGGAGVEVRCTRTFD